MMCDEDDGRPDTTFLLNPWFWLILLVCACIWGVVLWAALS